MKISRTHQRTHSRPDEAMSTEEVKSWTSPQKKIAKRLAARKRRQRDSGYHD